MIWTVSSANWPLEFGIKPTYKYEGNYTYWGIKNWGMQSKMVSKICEGKSGSSFCVKEFVVIVHKKIYTLYHPIIFLDILYSKSQAKLMVTVGTRHSHQIQLLIHAITVYLNAPW